MPGDDLEAPQSPPLAVKIAPARLGASGTMMLPFITRHSRTMAPARRPARRGLERQVLPLPDNASTARTVTVSDASRPPAHARQRINMLRKSERFRLKPSGSALTLANCSLRFGVGDGVH